MSRHQEAKGAQIVRLLRNWKDCNRGQVKQEGHWADVPGADAHFIELTLAADQARRWVKEEARIWTSDGQRKDGKRWTLLAKEKAKEEQL